MNNDFIDNYNGLLARVFIQDEIGNEICYIYELSILKDIAVKNNLSTYETYLHIGDKLRFEDGDYEIIRIGAKFLNETDSTFMKYGINMYGIGELLPFNFEITYVVKKSGS